MLVKAAPDEPLDQGLLAYVQFSSRFVQFLDHVLVQIDPDAVERRELRAADHDVERV